MMLAFLAEMIITATDTAFLGRLSALAIDGIAVSVLFFITFSVMLYGMAIGLQILIARRFGERNFDAIGVLFKHGFLLTFVFGLLSYCFFDYFVADILGYFLSSQVVLVKSLEYLEVMKYSFFLLPLNMCFRAFYVGTTNTQLITVNLFIMAMVNILLDYALIFGEWGFYKMEVSGAAYASVMAQVASTIFFIAYSFYKKYQITYRLKFFDKLQTGLLKEIILLSTPILTLYAFAVGGWFLFFVILEQYGERVLASGHIVRSVYMLMVVPVLGLAQIANMMVSNIIGQGKIELVPKLIMRITKMSFGITLFITTLCCLFPSQVLGIYTNDQNLIMESINVYYIMMFGLILFSIASISFNSVTGTGDAKAAMIIESSTIVIYVFTAYYLGIILHTSVEGVWLTEILYNILLGVFSIIWLLTGRWKRIKI